MKLELNDSEIEALRNLPETVAGKALGKVIESMIDQYRSDFEDTQKDVMYVRGEIKGLRELLGELEKLKTAAHPTYYQPPPYEKFSARH